MLNLFQPDECCGEDLADALRTGKLDDTNHWVHDDCGTEWSVRILSGEETDVRYWSPVTLIEIWR